MVRQKSYSRSTLASNQFLAAPQLPHAGISNTTVVSIGRRHPPRPIHHHPIYQTFCAGIMLPDQLVWSEFASLLHAGDTPIFLSSAASAADSSYYQRPSYFSPHCSPHISIIRHYPGPNTTIHSTGRFKTSTICIENTCVKITAILACHANSAHYCAPSKSPYSR